MKNNRFAVIDRILFTDLKPQHTSGKNDDWFLSQMAVLEVVPHYFQFAYLLEFITPVTARSRFYKRLIDNELADYYNYISGQLLNAGNREEKSFFVQVALQKAIKVKLQETCHETGCYRPDLLLSANGPGNGSQDRTNWETAYIYQYLKLSLVTLYLNIQVSGKDYLLSEPVTLNELLFMHAPGMVDEDKYIRVASKSYQPALPVSIAPVVSLTDNEKEKREPGTLPSSFDPVVNISKLDQVEERLKEYGILDKEGRFVHNRKESHHRRLAVVYKVMIDCGFFRKSDPVKKKKITPYDIRRYLDERYGVDLKETFRKLKPEHIEEAKIKLPWLDRLRP